MSEHQNPYQLPYYPYVKMSGPPPKERECVFFDACADCRGLLEHNAALKAALRRIDADVRQAGRENSMAWETVNILQGKIREVYANCPAAARGRETPDE